MQRVPHTYLHPSHFPLRQVALSGPHPRYRYPFGFMQTAFCSHRVSTVNTLRSSSSLESTAGTCQLLCSLFLIKMRLGFFDTIVSCFCSYLSHTFRRMPSFFVLMGSVLDVLSPSGVSSASWRWSWRKRAHLLSNSQLTPLPWTPDPHLRLVMSSQAASQPAFSFWIPIQVLTVTPPASRHPLWHQAKNLGLILDFFSLPFCFIWLISDDFSCLCCPHCYRSVGLLPGAPGSSQSFNDAPCL